MTGIELWTSRVGSNSCTNRTEPQPLPKRAHVSFQMGHSQPLFLYFRLFITVDSKCSIYIIANDWIQTENLATEQLVYQLSHNHCPYSHLYLLAHTC